ncbi:MAG: hypothetical protein HRT77_05200 [Halioglobus sp.]|nr:hypothetical protein [Halioglobus sp.]
MAGYLKGCSQSIQNKVGKARNPRIRNAGEWREYFSPLLARAFSNEYGVLLETLDSPIDWAQVLPRRITLEGAGEYVLFSCHSEWCGS